MSTSNSPSASSSGSSALPARAQPLATVANAIVTGPSPSGSVNPTAGQGLVQNPQAIHGQGLFYSIDPAEYVKNLTAIKTLLNEKNGLQKQLDSSADPNLLRYATLLGALINIPGVVLVGFGINLLTADKVPPYATWIFGIGVCLTLIATIGPVIATFMPRNKK